MSDENEFDEFDDSFEELDEAKKNLFLEVLDEQENIPVDLSRIRAVCVKILADSGITCGRIGVVLVDNEMIHELNRNFLKHDYPTDVISFQVESNPEEGYLEGEVIASVEMAKQRAPEFQWGTDDELLLYVIHGLLHLVGFDDIDEKDRLVIREKERYYLRFIGVEPNDLGFDAESDPDNTPTEPDLGSYTALYDEDAEKN